MGFLNFLKKKENLEMPPEPPEEILPELPELPSFEPLQERPISSPTIPKVIPPLPSIEEAEEVEMAMSRLAKPVFVNIIEYKNALDTLNDVKKVINETESRMSKLNDIEVEKQKMTVRYQDRIEDIQRKLIFLDKTLFEKR